MERYQELVSPEILSILVLVVIFIIATTLPINMGVLAFAAAVLVGGLVASLTADDIFAVFPGDRRRRQPAVDQRGPRPCQRQER